MTERRDPPPAPFVRGMTQRRYSRRQMLQLGGAAVGTMSLASILAACSGSGNRDEVNFANWPLYIDTAKDDDGQRYHPSLRAFTEESGIDVNYADVINSNDSFFGKLLPQLQARQDTGWDIVVFTNGREFTSLLVNEWVTELDPAARPFFDSNAATWAKDPDFDPGNRFSMAWQSGLTGIGYNTEEVNGTITTMDDLMNPSLVGTNSVGILSQDMADLVMINLGITPKDSGPEEWREAAAWLQRLKDSGTVRQFYDQGYVDDLNAGNLSATMGWSGDILYYAIWEDYPYEFVVPEGGALLWIDSMMIPVNAAKPQEAQRLMDFVYQPAIAEGITETVAYMSPVPKVQDRLAERAERDGDAALAGMAASPFLWPDEVLLAKTPLGRTLRSEEEREEWDSIFVPLAES